MGVLCLCFGMFDGAGGFICIMESLADQRHHLQFIEHISLEIM